MILGGFNGKETESTDIELVTNPGEFIC
jgi:hypothetical protein